MIKTNSKMKISSKTLGSNHLLFTRILFQLTLLLTSSVSLHGQIIPKLLLVSIAVAEIDSTIAPLNSYELLDSIQHREEIDSLQVPATTDCGCNTSTNEAKIQQVTQESTSRSACRRKCRETKRQEKRTCKAHKKQFKSCKKAARKTKRACKKSCKAVKKAEIKACKGKRGKSKRRCKKAARKKFRKCKRTCRADKRAAKKRCKTHKKTFRSCKKAARKKAKSCRKACRPVWCCSYCDKVAGPVNKEYRTSRFWAYLKCMWNGSGAGSCDFMGTKAGGSSLTRGKCPEHEGFINY